MSIVTGKNFAFFSNGDAEYHSNFEFVHVGCGLFFSKLHLSPPYSYSKLMNFQRSHQGIERARATGKEKCALLLH